MCLLPQRNPVYTAKEVATLDWLSSGRVDLGVGVGWLREEFEALEVPWERRGARTDDYLGVLQSLWTEDPSSFSGDFYHPGPLLPVPQTGPASPPADPHRRGVRRRPAADGPAGPGLALLQPHAGRSGRPGGPPGGTPGPRGPVPLRHPRDGLSLFPGALPRPPWPATRRPAPTPWPPFSSSPTRPTSPGPSTPWPPPWPRPARPERGPEERASGPHGRRSRLTVAPRWTSIQQGPGPPGPRDRGSG